MTVRRGPVRFLVFRKLRDLARGTAAFEESHGRSIVSGIEVTLNDPVFLRELDAAGRRKVAGLLAPYERTVHLPFYGINLGCFDRWIADYSEKTIREGVDFCREIGAARAVSHTTVPAYLGEEARPKWAPRFLERLERIERHAAERGVSLVWENTYEKDFVLFDAMIERVSSVRFCLDVGHVHCFAKRPVSELVAHLGTRIVHLHLHDNDGLDDRHWAIGKGTIDFEGIVALLPRMAVDTAVFELDPDEFRESVPRIERLFGKLL